MLAARRRAREQIGYRPHLFAVVVGVRMREGSVVGCPAGGLRRTAGTAVVIDFTAAHLHLTCTGSKTRSDGWAAKADAGMQQQEARQNEAQLHESRSSNRGVVAASICGVGPCGDRPHVPSH